MGAKPIFEFVVRVDHQHEDIAEGRIEIMQKALYQFIRMAEMGGGGTTVITPIRKFRASRDPEKRRVALVSPTPHTVVTPEEIARGNVFGPDEHTESMPKPKAAKKIPVRKIPVKKVVKKRG
jgi:hypothetical protein